MNGTYFVIASTGTERIYLNATRWAFHPEHMDRAQAEAELARVKRIGSRYAASARIVRAPQH